MTISEYFAHWCQLNSYLTLFPPHGRVVQKLKDDEIVELIYEQLPNHMQSDLKRMNEFNINNTNLTQFREVLEHLQLSYQLEKKTEKSKKLDTSNKSSEKSNGKHSGKKHTNSTNNSLPVSAKMPYLLHGTRSHTTDECKVVKEQIQHMKAMYNVQTLAEHTKKQKELKAKKAPTRDEINNMVVENIKKSVKEIFETQMKTL